MDVPVRIDYGRIKKSGINTSNPLITEIIGRLRISKWLKNKNDSGAFKNYPGRIATIAKNEYKLH